jgi:hypothetical protein
MIGELRQHHTEFVDVLFLRGSSSGVFGMIFSACLAVVMIPRVAVNPRRVLLIWHKLAG